MGLGSGVNEYVCDVFTGPSCQHVNEAGDNITKEECVAAVSDLPIAEGELMHVDSNTAGCRALHAVFAESNPSHCAHLSLTPHEDLMGKIKCQTSAGMHPAELFDQEEIDAFHQFSKN